MIGHDEQPVRSKYLDASRWDINFLSRRGIFQGLFPLTAVNQMLRYERGGRQRRGPTGMVVGRFAFALVEVEVGCHWIVGGAGASPRFGGPIKLPSSADRQRLSFSAAGEMGRLIVGYVGSEGGCDWWLARWGCRDVGPDEDGRWAGLGWTGSTASRYRYLEL